MEERKAYMVLSIERLNSMLKKAREKSKKAYGKIAKYSTIVLNLQIENEDFNSDDGARQINIVKFY